MENRDKISAASPKRVSKPKMRIIRKERRGPDSGFKSFLREVSMVFLLYPNRRLHDTGLGMKRSFQGAYILFYDPRKRLLRFAIGNSTELYILSYIRKAR